MPSKKEIVEEYHELGLETVMSENQYLEWYKKGIQQLNKATKEGMKDTTELRDMRGLAQFAHLRLLSVTDMEKLIARQNTCIAQLTTDHENAARYKEALEAIPMVLNMGASQQDVLNIVNNALKED